MQLPPSRGSGVSRTPGVVAIAALLAWSAAGALFSSLALLMGTNQIAMLGVQRAPTIASALVFAVTAAWSAIGLWRAAVWTRTALTLWAVVANVWAMLFLAMMARGGRLPPLPWPVLAVAVLPFLALPWLLVWYARRRMPVPPS
jgi:hypothetical protein